MADKFPFRKGKEAMYAHGSVKNVGEYLKLIRNVQDEWDQLELYYRGVSRLTHTLVPGAYRDSWHYDVQDMSDMFNDFVMRGKAMSSSRYSVWDWYIVMQHHGLPTRLLDWTERSLIALHFALSSFESVLKPAVWILDPYWLNQQTTDKQVQYFVDDETRDADDEVVDKYIIESDELPESPIAVRPPYVNPRIAAQRSVFTVHGRAKNGIHDVFRRGNGGHVARITVAPSSVGNLRRELIGAGISETTVFPDLDGLARELRHDHGSE